MNKQLHTDLVAARAALVGRFGKCNYFSHKTQCFCALGAGAYAVQGFTQGVFKKHIAYNQNNPRVTAVAKALRDAVPEEVNRNVRLHATDEEVVAYFNDKRETTEADVLAMYDRAIEEAAAA